MKPTMQKYEALAPSVVEYFPAWQTWQVVELFSPIEEENVPCLQ
jgi:hypothetical protein